MFLDQFSVQETVDRARKTERISCLYELILLIVRKEKFVSRKWNRVLKY